MPSKPATPRPALKSDLMDLKKEVTALKRQLAKMEKALEKAEQKASVPGKVQATQLTAAKIEVVDPEGEVLASIDKNGTLFCRKLVVGDSPKDKRLVVETGGRIQAAELACRGEGDRHPVAVVSGTDGAGRVDISNRETNQEVILQAKGNPLVVNNDLTGDPVIVVTSNGEQGGRVQFLGVRKTKASTATIGIHPGSGAGTVIVQDAKGIITGKLPE